VRTSSPPRTRRARALSLLAAAMLFLGYAVLIHGDVTIAPLLLVASYVGSCRLALLAH
jgi:hypothetical protein